MSRSQALAPLSLFPLAFVACLTASVSAAAAPTAAPDKPPPRPLGKNYGSRVALDLNVEGGLGGLILRERFTGFGRVRAGVTTVLESHVDPTASPLFITLGATYDISDLSLATVGLQTEVIHLITGIWVQAGAMVDVTEPEPGWMFSAGWSSLGVEVQRRRYSDDQQTGEGKADWALYGKLRLPVSLLLGAL